MYNKFLNIFIARRISSSATTSQGRIMVRIATLSVAVSVAIIIIAVNIIIGFKREITSKVIGFASHYNIITLNDRANLPIESEQKLVDELGELPFFSSISPYVEKGGILKSGDGVEGVVLKGVDGSYDMSFFAGNIIEGSLPSFADSVKSKEVLISKSLSMKMGLSLGDRFEMMFISDDNVFRDLLTIGAIYQTSLEELDRIMIVGDIRVAQRVSSMSESQITGYELMTDDFYAVDSNLDAVENVVFGSEQRLQVVAVTDKYIQIFDWLKLQDTNIWVILTIMICVAAFNTIAMLLIVLIDKSSMIGVLKALGMRNSDIQNIFILRSLSVVLKGVAWGVLVSLSLSIVQHYTHWIKLSEEAYFIGYVPIEINYLYILLIVVVTIVSLVVLQLLPVKMIAKVQPSKSIKFG